MTIANVSQRSAAGLPLTLKTAQDAIHLPEVQAMLRRLSEYQLGIFMPHMHDQRTGEFHSLPADLTQVESGLEVSFEPTQKVADQADRFMPVGWFWRAGASSPAAVCEMVDGETPTDPGRVKHKMPKGSQQ